MKDIMLDLESFGTGPKGMLSSIGAVFFDLNTGETGEEFYCNVNIESSFKYGLVADGGAIKFWCQQPEEARMAMFENPTPIALPDALAQFSKFYGKHRKTNIWGNGCNFDNILLGNAYKAIGKEQPWGFTNDRDVRTLVQLGKMSGLQRQDCTREGTHHHALDDAKFQVKYCSYIYKYLKENQW